jgi:hypothetical protein
MRNGTTLCVFLLCLIALRGQSQTVSAPEPQTGSIVGIVTDPDESVIPNATIVVEDASTNDRHTGISASDGSFLIEGLRPWIAYHVVIHAKSFADWSSSTSITLRPGQQWDLTEVKLAVAEVSTTVSAIQPEQLAIEQVKEEEKQRVLGIFPNFYTAYDPRIVPLSAKLKFSLALRASTDVATLGASAFLAGINQASDGSPNYVQGAKGYGQRFGAAYAVGATNIFLGGAILPAILHQDPRYFYQGTGSHRSRAWHAIAAPFWTRNDNGRWEFNYSSIGGDFATGALANTYYPPRNRGAGLVFSTALTSIGGRVANALAQEFILSKFTKGKTTP